jgi:hypothetical protein
VMWFVIFHAGLYALPPQAGEGLGMRDCAYLKYVFLCINPHP